VQDPNLRYNGILTIMHISTRLNHLAYKKVSTSCAIQNTLEPKFLTYGSQAIVHDSHQELREEVLAPTS
jgi:hypothetical protein